MEIPRENKTSSPAMRRAICTPFRRGNVPGLSCIHGVNALNT